MAHFKNVTNVIPCLAGKLFTPQMINMCLERKVIPVYPSGGRFIVGGLHLLAKFVK